ncbi:MAG TPA: hypothetical protein VGL31_09330, partial [Xanthobacteraceae bacterium]
MWRSLKITWLIACRVIEIAIVLYVLNAISDRNTALIVGVLGLLYATIRSIGLGLAMAAVQIGAAVDLQFYQLTRLLDPGGEPVKPDHEQ